MHAVPIEAKISPQQILNQLKKYRRVCFCVPSHETGKSIFCSLLPIFYVSSRVMVPLNFSRRKWVQRFPPDLVCFVAWTTLAASTVRLTFLAVQKCLVPVSQGKL